MTWSASFLAWINQPVRDAVAVWKLTATQTDGSTAVRYVSTEQWITESTDTPANETILGRLVAETPFSAGIVHPFGNAGSAGSVGGQIELLNADGVLDDWADWDWRDQIQELYLGDRSWAFSSFERVLKVVADSAEADLDELRIVIGDQVAAFDKPLQVTRFADTAVNPAIRGELQPALVGRAHFVPPALEDHVDLEYIFADSTDVDLAEVFANAFQLGLIDGSANGTWTVVTGAPADVVVSVNRLILNTPFPYTAPAFEAYVGSGFLPANDQYFEFHLTQPNSGLEQFTTSVGIALSNTTNPADDLRYEVAGDGAGNLVHQVVYGSTNTVTLPDNVFEERIGVWVTNGTAHLYRSGVLIFSYPLAAGTWYPWAEGISPITIAHDIFFYSNSEDWLYPPTETVVADAYGNQGDFLNSPANEIDLVRDPTRALITAHAASESTLGFELGFFDEDDWKVQGANDRTIECQSFSTDKSAAVPALRSAGRYAVEIDIDQLGGTPAVELVGAWPFDPELATIGQGRDVGNYGGVSWRSGGTIRGGAAQVFGSGVGFGTANVVAFVVDKDAGTIEAWKDGVLAFTAIDGADVSKRFGAARGPFSAANYFSGTSPVVTPDTKKASGCMILRMDTSPTTTGRVSWWGSRGVEVFLLSTDVISIRAENSAGAVIGRIDTSTLTVGTEYAILWSFDLETGEEHLYVNDVSDITVVTSTNDTIDCAPTSRALGATSAGASPVDTSVISQFGLAVGVCIDFSVEANRRKFFAPDGYPVYAGADGSRAFGVQPVFWCPNGDGTENTGTAGALTETGTVPEEHVAMGAFARAAFAPGFLCDATGDIATVRLNGLTYSYNGAREWGSAASAAEIVHDLANGSDDLVHNVNEIASFAAGLGWFAEGGESKMEILEAVARSVGGGLTVSRDGLLRIIRIVDPETQTADVTIDYDMNLQAGGNIRRSQDRGERLSAAIAAWQVWKVHSAGEVAGDVEDGALADLVQRRYGITSKTAIPFAPLYTDAQTAEPIQTVIADGDPLDDAKLRSSDELARIVGELYQVRRHVYRFPFVGVPLLEVGDVVQLNNVPRWGLDAGVKLLVVGLEGVSDIDNAGVALLWG